MKNNLTYVFVLLLAPVFLYAIAFYSGSVALFTESGQDETDEKPSVVIVAQEENGAVRFTALANDDRSVKTVKIYVSGTEVKSCQFEQGASVTCEYEKSYSPGTYSYKALVSDGYRSVATSDQTIVI